MLPAASRQVPTAIADGRRDQRGVDRDPSVCDMRRAGGGMQGRVWVGDYGYSLFFVLSSCRDIRSQCRRERGEYTIDGWGARLSMVNARRSCRQYQYQPFCALDNDRWNEDAYQDGRQVPCSAERQSWDWNRRCAANGKRLSRAGQKCGRLEEARNRRLQIAVSMGRPERMRGVV